MLAVGLLLTHALAGSVGNWDEHVNRWFVPHRTDFWNSFTGGVTFMLDTFPVIGVALVVVLLLIWRRHWQRALVIVFGLTVEIMVFLSVTFIVARPRPDVPRLSSAPMTSSFPSGHTAAAVVLYGGIALVFSWGARRNLARVLVWIAAVALVATVAVSRVYRGMHHPTDVIAGALFGMACLSIAVGAVRAVSAAHRDANDETRVGPRSPEPIELDVVA
jgi:membrane-associated phospholipid phosphatase